MKKIESQIYAGFGESREYPGKAVEYGIVNLGFDGMTREFYSEVLLDDEFDEFDESRAAQIEQSLKTEIADYFGVAESDIKLSC